MTPENSHSAPFRMVIFTASAAPHLVRTVAKLVEDQPDAEVLILHHAPGKSLPRLLRNQWRNLGRHGWRWLPYQARESTALIGAKARRSPAAEGRLAAPRTLDALATARPVVYQKVRSINAEEVTNRLEAWQPDLGLSIAAPILKPRLFGIPRLGTLNIHKGALPSYRGMPPAFWELWHGESAVGVSVHQVESGLDAGGILLEETIPVERFSTPAGLRVQLDERGVELVVRAARLMREGPVQFRPQKGEPRTFTRPTLAQERELAARLSARDLRRAAKNTVLNAYALAAKASPEYRRRTVVLLYHRVNDSFRDAVTIGVEQFETHMQFLADHYNVVRLEDIVAGRASSGDGPVVAVTFDDGYLDNYENAAPILIKYGLPATFFVSTDHISFGIPFEHDLRKLGKGLPNMSWDQIRAMQKEGLSFGSHTANHVNLARADADLAVQELTHSKTTIQRELGLDEVMFAYPFGKRADLRPDNVEMIKAAGYLCNCSAYGGVNPQPADRWDIRRQGIDHTFDTAALRAKIAGWKSHAYV